MKPPVISGFSSKDPHPQHYVPDPYQSMKGNQPIGQIPYKSSLDRQGGGQHAGSMDRQSPMGGNNGNNSNYFNNNAYNNLRAEKFKTVPCKYYHR